MKKRIPGALITIILLACGVAGQKLEAPKLEPTASTENQQQLIKDGVALHDKGDYEGAVNHYEQVLKENPNNVLALYEMSYSYYAQKNYQKSIEVAFKAARYKSPLLEAIYVQLGSAFDELGDSRKAIETYKFGIKLDASSAPLQYNLAITYFRSQQLEEAKTAAKKAVALDPTHPGSQLLLSTIFEKGSYKVPALLAALRFLILEPDTKRSEVAVQRVTKIMQAGVSPAKDGKNMSILMDAEQKKDEGDFESVAFFLSLMKAANYTEKNKDKTELQLLIDNFNSLFGMLSESTKADLSKFTWKYYVPYFIELKQQGHTETFVYYVHRKSTIAGVNKWLDHNQSKVADFLAWSKAHRWPKLD